MAILQALRVRLVRGARAEYGTLREVTFAPTRCPDCSLEEMGSLGTVQRSMAHPLDGAFAKYDAALNHFNLLTAETVSFLKSDQAPERRPYSEELVYNAEEEYFSIIAHVREQPSHRFATRIGDVVHNLASSLDCAMYELAKLRAGHEVPQTSFPIYGDVRQYRTFRRSKSCWMKFLTLSDRSFLDRMQPFQAGPFEFAHPFAQLYLLWNRDKHRTLNATLAMVAEYGFRGRPNEDISAIRWPPKYNVGPVDEGTEILRLYVVPSGPAPAIEIDAEVTLDIGLEDGVRIRHTLADIANYVQHVLEWSARRFPDGGFTFDEWQADHST